MVRFERVISTIDAHAAGEPLRIITAGLPPLQGRTVLERRRYMAEHFDDIRRMLLFEPRGHADMYGAVLTPPVTPGADFGVLFLTNEGYSTMCGHGVIALTTVLLETGMLDHCEPRTDVVYDSPAGRIRANAEIADGRVTSVAFRNVPSFRYAQGLDLATSVGPLRADVSYGGAFYALVNATDLGIEVLTGNASTLTRLGMEIKRAVERSPCGTGTSAKLACLYADGRISRGQPYVHESVIGTTFTGRVLEETSVGPYQAVETEIAGRGFLTGFQQFVVDPEDVTAGGFLVR